MRASIDQVEITTWNDYGEADHVAPLLGDLPPEAKVWTTPERESEAQTPVLVLTNSGPQ